MSKCKICHTDTDKLIDGVCLLCFNKQALDNEKSIETLENTLGKSMSQYQNPITDEDVKQLRQRFETLEIKRTGIDIAMDKLDIHTKEEWLTKKPDLDRVILKYREEILNHKYDVMAMSKFIRLRESGLVLVENYKGIAVYYRERA